MTDDMPQARRPAAAASSPAGSPPPGATAGPARLQRLYWADAGSCRGCELELWSLFAPPFCPDQHGLSLTGSVVEADILGVAGPVSHNLIGPLTALALQRDPNCRLVAIGDCACDGGVFAGSYGVQGGVAATGLSVDVLVPGCPPAPETLQAALKQAE